MTLSHPRRRMLRAVVVLSIATIASVLSCGNATLPSVKPYRPVQGAVADVTTTALLHGGWRVSWTATPHAERYVVAVDGVPLPATTATAIRIPDTAEVRSGRPAPIVSITPITTRLWLPRMMGATSTATATTALACSPYTFVGVRGSGQNSDPDGWGDGMGDRARNILTATRRQSNIGNSTLTGVGVTYPAHRADTIDGALTYRQSTQAGIKALRDSLWAWTQECPTTRLILFGYSQGADIIATTWPTLDDSLRQQVERVILFGDPHYNPADSTARNPTAVHTGPLTAREPLHDPRISSWCSEGDVVCQATLGNFLALRQRVHGYRYDEWQEQVADELAAHLRSLGAALAP